MGKPIREARLEAGANGADPPLLRRRGAPVEPASSFEQASDRKRRLHDAPTRSAWSTQITPWNFPAAIPAWKARAGARVRKHRRS